MEETNTTELYLEHTTSGYMDYGENIIYECPTVVPYGLKVFGVVSLGISLCGLVGNGAVVWFLGFHMKKSPFTVYVLNLAIADFSLLLFLGMLILDIIIEFYCHFSGEWIRWIKYIMLILFLFYYFASMYLLTAISIERCLSALFPIWYRCHRPRHLSGIMCGVLWALAGLFVSLLLIYNSIYIHTYLKVLKYVCIGNSLIFCLLPLFSNLFLFIKLQCSSQRQWPGRLYVAILVSAIFLFLFGFPLTVAVLLSDYYNLGSTYFGISSMLASLNSSVNPFIYFLVGSWRQRRIQRSVKVAFQRVFEEQVTSEEENHDPGDTTAVTTL